MKRIIAVLVALFALTSWAGAQTYCRDSSGATHLPITSSLCDQLGVAATVSASVSGFAPGGAYATLTVTNVSSRVALPTGGTVIVYNTGTTAVSCVLGNGSVVAVANEDQVQASSWIAFTVGSNVDIACIDQTGSTSNLVVISGGSGLPSGAGGGGGSGGSSAITSWGGGTLGAMANYGTSPGAVLVPGMNSFVTNTVTVAGTGTFATQAAQSGTWTVQPGNTANTTPWLASINQGSNTALVKAGNTGAAADQALIVADPNVLAAVNAGVGTNNVAIPANVINIGAQAVNAENTPVTATRQAQLVTDLVGKLIMLPYANPENFVSGVISTAMTGTTSTLLIAAPAAGLRNYVTQCSVSDSSTTTATDLILQDGSGGTTIYVIPAPINWGGAELTFPTPLRQPTTATGLYAQNVTTGSNTKIACSGYKGA